MIRIARQLREGRWEFSLTTVATLLDIDKTLYLGVDQNKPIKFKSPKDYVQKIALNDFGLIDREKQALLMLQMQEGQVLRATFRSKRGKKIKVLFSLEGLSETLLWITQHQTRTTQASAILTRLPEPRKPGIPRSLLRRHARSANCTRTDKSATDGLPKTISRLDRDHILYLLPCGLSAGNITYRSYIVFRDRYADAKPLYFARYSQLSGWLGTDLLYNHRWNEKTRTLISLNRKGRLGDCGSEATYRWAGSTFKLLKYRYWEKCDGSRSIDNWPVVFKAPAAALPR